MFYDLLIFIFMSYIKPQPASSKHRIHPDCISYYSYIKPQPLTSPIDMATVVYRTIPTSNHNSSSDLHEFPCVVYRTIPTSNHN